MRDLRLKLFRLTAQRLAVFLVSFALAFSALAVVLPALSVAQSSPTFTISAPSGAQTGSTVAITGKICPDPNAPLGVGGNVTYTAPNGSRFVRSGFMGYGGSGFCSQGFGVDSLVPDSAGTWSAVAWAYWQDYSSGTYYQVESNAITVQVGQATTTTTTTTTTRTTTNPPPGVTGSGNQTIQKDTYYYWNVDVTGPSYVLYYTLSNVSVSSAFMTAAQFAAFSGGTSSITAALTEQNGTENFDGLLVPAGSYYFTVCACAGSASVAYDYNASLSLQATNDTTDVGLFLTLPPMQGTGLFYRLPLHLETGGSPTRLSLFGISNQTVEYSLYNAVSGERMFASQPVTTTNINGSIPVTSSFSPTYNFSLPIGYYSVHVFNDHDTPAYVYVSYHLRPAYVNPYLLSGGAPPKPTGIASFGLYNDSGKMVPYTINSEAVAAFANITALEATNLNASQIGLPPKSAGIQLNSIIMVNNTDGSQYEYWSQNIVQFVQDSGNDYYHFLDNVWNMTGDGASLNNSTITSDYGGTTSRSNYYDFYPSYTNFFLYRFPLAMVVGMNVTVLPGQGLEVGFAYELLQNGTAVGSPSNYWYDRAFIADPLVGTAAFHTSGTDYTPAGANAQQGLFFDTEWVFGGNVAGATSTFSSLDATLGLYYLDSATGKSTPFPSYYSFGSDTAENTPSVQVAYLGSGVAQAYSGSPDYVYLVAQPGSTSTSTTSHPTGTSVSPAGSGFNYLYLVIPVVAVVALAALLMRRRGAGPGGYPPPPPPPGM